MHIQEAPNAAIHVVRNMMRNRRWPRRLELELLQSVHLLMRHHGLQQQASDVVSVTEDERTIKKWLAFSWKYPVRFLYGVEGLQHGSQ